MVVIRPPVWISIWLTLIDCVQVEEISVIACSGREYECSNFKLNCTLHHIRIIVAEYRYNRKNNCEYVSCSNSKQCCVADNNDCKENFTDTHLNDLLLVCDRQHWCGPIPSPPTPTLDYVSRCKEYNYPGFIHLTYTCIPPGTDTSVQLTSTTNGLSSSGNKSSSSGTSTIARQTGTSATTSNTIQTSTSEVISSDKHSSTALTSASLNRMDIDREEHPERLIIILVVVVAVLVLSAILVIVLILHRRRCKKSSQEDAPNNQLPYVMINHSNINFEGTDQDFKAVESFNYDEVNDESIGTYSRPVKKKTDGSTITKNEKKIGGNGAMDEYDRIEFEKKYPVKMKNYDSVSAIEVNTRDDTYSHVSSQSKPASAGVANDYSHCQVIRNESRSNDYANKIAVSNEPLLADNYSHVNLNAEKTKIRPSNINKEFSYSPNEPDRNSRASSRDPPLQDMKAVSLPDKYIEFKIGDIYDTPVCRDQQYTVVLKGNSEQSLNSVGAISKQNSANEENNGVIEDSRVRSDYELAKPIDF